MKQLFKILPFLLCAGLLAFVPAVRVFKRENLKQVLVITKLLLVVIALQGQSFVFENNPPVFLFDSVQVQKDTVFIYRSWDITVWELSGAKEHKYVDRLVYAYDRKQKQIVFVRREEAQKELVFRERLEKYYETKWIWKQ